MQYCYKSKCNKINLCCGLIHIDRNIQAEQDIESGSYHNPDYIIIPIFLIKNDSKNMGKIHYL